MPGRAGQAVRAYVSVSRLWRRMGPLYVLLWSVDRCLSAALSCRVLVVVTHAIDAVLHTGPPLPAGFTLRFLTPDELGRFARDDDGWFSSAFTSDALARGDRCFGILEGGRLVHYCWYSTRPTTAFQDVQVSVDRRFTYGYKAYTDVAYRRLGLHTHAVAAATAQLSNGVLQGVVAYVEASNAPSLLAAMALGDDVVGFVLLGRVANRPFSFATAGCDTVGFVVHAIGPEVALAR